MPTTGLEFTRREIVAKIHIGEATLAKRVSEFATTSAGALTMNEFDNRAQEIEAEQMALLENIQPVEDPNKDPGCTCLHIGEPLLCTADADIVSDIQSLAVLDACRLVSDIQPLDAC